MKTTDKSDNPTETTKVKMTNPSNVNILTWGGEVIKPGETKMVDVPVVNTEMKDKQWYITKRDVTQPEPEESQENLLEELIIKFRKMKADGSTEYSAILCLLEEFYIQRKKQ